MVAIHKDEPGAPMEAVRMSVLQERMRTEGGWGIEMPVPVELNSSATLLTDLNENLAHATTPRQNFEINPQTLAEFLKSSSLFGPTVAISNLDMTLRDNILGIDGILQYKGRDIPTKINLRITDEGRLEVDGAPEINYDNLNPLERRFAPGRVNSNLANLESNLAGAINSQIDASWGVQGFQAEDGKLAIDVTKKPSR